MRKHVINGHSLELVVGDITNESVDAIVNAANSKLAGGGGVDGAIHRRGGSTIMSETKLLYPNGCPIGSAVVSNAGKLNAKWVFHAVGPIWEGGSKGEPKLLASAYLRCLELATEHACKSVAFPAISTGVYGYPLSEAARVALVTVGKYLKHIQQPMNIRFVLFSNEVFEVFATELQGVAHLIKDCTIH